uniref:SGF29 C-terminal domain-containing protein n=1 Tax=Meloidogyne javanica TaxID=6303 RepID=A0A915MQP9_MELJA
MRQRQKTPKTTNKTSKNSPIKNNNLSTTCNVAASEETSTIKQITNFTEQISEKMLRLQPKHQKVNESLRAIRSQGVRLLGPGSKISQNSKAKLIALYQTAQKQCVSEHSTIMQLLDNIQTVRQLRLKQRMADKLSRGSLMILLAQHAATLPLYVGYIEGHPPPLVGAIPRLNGEPISVGHFVAAFSEDIWILGEVKAHIPTDYGLEYSIRDIDDEVEEEGVIALPHYRADPRRHAHALFPKGAIVLALYPQTTCFYKGIVETPPSGPNDDYLWVFNFF